MAIEQGDGYKERVERTIWSGRKRFRPMKLMRSSYQKVVQALGLKTTSTYSATDLVSEYMGQGGLRGGCIPIAKDSEAEGENGQGFLPMHVFDLNQFIGGQPDTITTYTTVASTNMNSDVNARAWIWRDDNTFRPMRLADGKEPRWMHLDPRYVAATKPTGTHVYREGIDIKYMLYGSRDFEIEYDVMVIKITDLNMLPDIESLSNVDYQGNLLNLWKQNWQQLVRGFVINPLLRGDRLPGPRATKPWFKVCARKKVKVPAQAVESYNYPTVRGRIHVNINENTNMAWDTRGFTLETDTAANPTYPTYDNVPIPDDYGQNENWTYRPHPLNRYYLVIRASGYADQAGAGNNEDGLVGPTHTISDFFNEDGIPSAKAYTQGSYDLSIRTTWGVLTGI